MKIRNFKNDKFVIICVILSIILLKKNVILKDVNLSNKIMY